MILAGLLSLTVEFFRTNPVPCPANEFTWNPSDGNTSICGLTCDVESGPFSPLRGGSQNNIYVIEAPDILPFGAVTLLAAACCIPAILSLVSMWTKIQKINWRRRFGGGQGSAEDINAPISGTNNATQAKMTSINEKVRFYLSMIEVPVFGIMVLLIIIFGERNFFSHRVAYNTEPIASVGKSIYQPYLLPNSSLHTLYQGHTLTFILLQGSGHQLWELVWLLWARYMVFLPQMLKRMTCLLPKKSIVPVHITIIIITTAMTMTPAEVHIPESPDLHTEQAMIQLVES